MIESGGKGAGKPRSPNPSGADLQEALRKQREKTANGKDEESAGEPEGAPVQEPEGDSGGDASAVGPDGGGEREEDRGDAGAGEGVAAASERKEGRRTLKETAADLKTTAKALYEMDVPLNDGSGRYLSVEDLKAGYLRSEAGQLDAERHIFAQEKAAHELKRQDAENKALRDQREMMGLLDAAKRALPPEVIKALTERTRQTIANEALKVMETMPQFRDQTVYAGWLSKATPVLADYGFSAAEAQNISDHRMYKFLDDFMRLRDRIAALDRVPDPVPPRRGATRSGKSKISTGQRGAVERAKRAGATRSEKVAGVKAILG